VLTCVSSHPVENQCENEFQLPKLYELLLPSTDFSFNETRKEHAIYQEFCRSGFLVFGTLLIRSFGSINFCALHNTVKTYGEGRPRTSRILMRKL
jgi:hypothetical protein